MEHPWEVQFEGAQEAWEAFLSGVANKNILVELEALRNSRNKNFIFRSNEYTGLSLLAFADYSYLYVNSHLVSFILKIDELYESMSVPLRADMLPIVEGCGPHKVKTLDFEKVLTAWIEVNQIWHHLNANQPNFWDLRRFAESDDDSEPLLNLRHLRYGGTFDYSLYFCNSKNSQSLSGELHLDWLINESDLGELTLQIASVIAGQELHKSFTNIDQFGRSGNYLLVVFREYTYLYSLFSNTSTMGNPIYYSRFYNRREEREQMLAEGQLPDEAKYEYIKVRTSDLHRVVKTIHAVGEIWKSEQNLDDK